MQRLTVLLASAILAAATLPIAAQAGEDWVEIKNPEELRALYSNKTFRGRGWVGHYRADGTGVMIVEGSKPVRRSWAVKGGDQVCVTPEGGSVQCFKFRFVSKDRREVMLTNVANGWNVLFSVEDGVPKF